MKRKLFAMLVAISILLAMGPMMAMAADDVAQIGDTSYASLDEAIAAAADGDVIELLADCTSNGMNLNKNLTIKGAYTITFVDKGIALWGKSLTFEDCTVNMTGIGATPATGDGWTWMTICASKNSGLTLKNATMTMDGTGTDSNTHAIYFTGNNKLNLIDSTLTIKEYPHNALEWDGGDGGYNVNIVNSTFNSDHNRSAFTGTFYATIDNSEVNVTNSRGNGSNGTYYTITNNSKVDFSNNRNWGISAWRIDISNNSSLTTTDNGYSGVWTRVLNVDSTSTLDVKRNGNHSTGETTNAGIVFQGNKDYASVLEDGAKVTIKDNAGSGIYTKQTVCNLSIGSATIVDNGSGAVDTYNGYTANLGGGIYNVGTIVLGNNVLIEDNHAAVAGADIYSTGTMTVDPILEGEVFDYGCFGDITGWYRDEENNRWQHGSWDYAASNYTSNYTEEVKPGTYTDTIAFIAAHGAPSATIMKVDNSGKQLEDATFTLSRTEDDGITYYVSNLREGTDVDGNRNASVFSWTTNKDEAKAIALGKLHIDNLECGDTYDFTEVTAPRGYKALTDPIPFAMTSDTEDNVLRIVNNRNSGGGGGGTVTPQKVTLHYESNGGTSYTDEHYTHDTTVDLDKTPFRQGYAFTGWYADADLTNKITNITMTSDKTVYAGWKASVVPPALNDKDHFSYIVGYPDGTVQPQGNITRAEVAEIFFRLLKDDTRDGNLQHNNSFNDVHYGEWYNPAVSTLSKLDIIKGMTATEFAPNASITRAQFAAICARFDTGKTEGTSNFSDISGHWAEKEIERAVSLGWIAGYEDGTFRPDRSITRAEAMSIINRVLNRLPENESDLLSDMTKWPDNQPNAWYYLAVQEATNSHDYERKENGINETWINMKADPDWFRYQEK